MPLLNIAYGRTNVRSLGREDPLGPVGEAGAVAKAASQVESSMKNIYARHIELRLESMNLELQKGVSQWEANNKPKPFYSANELPDDINVEKTRTIVDENGTKTEELRMEIPSYEVYPQLYKRHTQALIDAQSERMPNSKIRGEWGIEKKAILDSSYASAMVVSNAKVAKYQEQRTILNVDEAMESGNFFLASEMARGIKDPINRQKKIDEINKTKETDDYNQALRTEDLEQLHGALEFLNLENYRDTGYLSEQDRRIWSDTIKNRIDSIQAGFKTDNAANVALAKHKSKTIKNLLLDGADVAPEVIIDSLNTLTNLQVGASGSTVGALEISKLELSNAVRYKTDAYPILQLPFPVRDQVIRRLDALSSKDPYTLELIRYLGKQSETAFDMEMKDPWKYALNYGVIGLNDYPPFNTQDVAGSLAKRTLPAEKMRKRMGYSKGFLTGEETRILANQFDSARAEDKVSVASEVVKGVGDKYPAVFEQLHDGGLKGSYASAGVIAASGDSFAALEVIKGQERLDDKQIKWVTKGLREELTDFMHEKFANAYPQSERHKSLMISAFNAAYVSQMNITDIESDKIDETFATNAFNMVTGGLVEWAESTVNPPSRGYGQDRWEKYIKTTHHSELLIMNDGATPVAYTTEELMNLVRKKEVQFIDKGILGGNEYHMLHRGQLILGSDGREYLYKVTQDPLTIKEVKAGKVSESLAKRKELTLDPREWYKDSYLNKILKKWRNKK